MSQTYYAALSLNDSTERLILDTHYAQAEKAGQARIGCRDRCSPTHAFRLLLVRAWRDFNDDPRTNADVIAAATPARDLFAALRTPSPSATEQDIARQAAYSADGETL